MLLIYLEKNPNLLFTTTIIPQTARRSVTQSSSHSSCLSLANLNSQAKGSLNWATNPRDSPLNASAGVVGEWHCHCHSSFEQPSLTRTTILALADMLNFACLTRSSNNICSYVCYVMFHNTLLRGLRYSWEFITIILYIIENHWTFTIKSWRDYELLSFFIFAKQAIKLFAKPKNVN